MMNNRDNLISIIVPCYNEEHAIPYFYKAITEHSTLMKMNLALILNIYL